MVLNVLAVVLALLSLANPSADMELLRRSGGADPRQVVEVLEAGRAEMNGQTRAQQCMDAFLSGELYRKADALSPGLGYAEKALEYFRAMRIDYVDLSAGQLGYIGEARVHNQLGDPQEALATLAPLLEGRVEARMRRLASREAMEAELKINPRLALTRAGEVGVSADWVRARSYAAMEDAEKALGYARSESAIAAASAFDRLQLIADLGALDDVERVAWARGLAVVGRDDDALAVLDADAPAGTAELHAVLLQRTGRLDEAVERWRDALDQGAGQKARFSYAVCLQTIAEQADTGDVDELRSQAINAYGRVVASDADDGLRRDAFRRWFFLSGPDAKHELITTHGELIGSDPYLRYARLRVIREALDPNEITMELSAIVAEATEPGLRASAVLMWAQIEPDPRAALGVLGEHWELLAGDAATAQTAQQRRVELWVGLGMIDRAVIQMLADSEAQPADSMLMVGSALAERYADGVQGDAQTQVLRLAGAAIGRAPGDETVALSAAALMLRVDARADAVRVLASIESPDAAVLHARALRQSDRVSEALDRLEMIDTPEAALERGMCLIVLKQAEAALREARVARSGLKAGGDTWWHATLMLARAHLAMGEPEAASDVLRVSEALYPVNGRSWISDELNTLKKELEG